MAKAFKLDFSQSIAILVDNAAAPPVGVAPMLNRAPMSDGHTVGGGECGADVAAAPAADTGATARATTEADRVVGFI